MIIFVSLWSQFTLSIRRPSLGLLPFLYLRINRQCLKTKRCRFWRNQSQIKTSECYVTHSFFTPPTLPFTEGSIAFCNIALRNIECNLNRLLLHSQEISSGSCYLSSISEVRFERFKGQKFAIKTAEVSCYFWTNWVVATWNFGAPPFWSLKDNKHDVGCWRPKAPEGRWLDHHRDLFYSVHDRGTMGEFNTICSSLKAIGRKPRRGCLQLTLYTSWVQVL